MADYLEFRVSSFEFWILDFGFTKLRNNI